MATVEVYSKSRCPFCRMAKCLLEEKGQEFVEFDVELDPTKYDEMLERSQGRWTVPEIFIDGELIGGFDEIVRSIPDLCSFPNLPDLLPSPALN